MMEIMRMIEEIVLIFGDMFMWMELKMYIGRVVVLVLVMK